MLKHCCINHLRLSVSTELKDFKFAFDAIETAVILEVASQRETSSVLRSYFSWDMLPNLRTCTMLKFTGLGFFDDVSAWLILTVTQKWTT